MYTSVQNESFKQIARLALLQRRAELVARHEATDESARELFDLREVDWEDRAANVTEAQRLMQLGESERAQIALVQTALDRLDEGSWGTCVVCGRPIDEARLRVAPEALGCARCTNRHYGH
jgi:RNA polymerase-binding transcription factor DksA